MTAPDTCEALQHAVASSAPSPLRIAGAGTKAQPARDDDAVTIDVRGLSGLVSYNPAECVLTARAGTPVAAIEAALAAHDQHLPFDPTHRRAGGTIGGTVATALSGPGRYRYGGVRDFVIGARVVDGLGRLITSGGQVVKNAAGFLTHHALVGSAGRLGAIAEVTVKVFPRPEARATVRARLASAADAWAAHERVRAVAMDLDALDVQIDAPAPDATVWLRLAGAAAALPARVARARQLLAVPSDVWLDGDDARAWSDAAEFAWTAGAATIVKVPTAPSRALDVLRTLGALGPCRMQCGGAVTFVGTAAPVDAIHTMLAERRWRGVVACGAASGRLLGAAAPGAFGDRARHVLDPEGRFR